MSTWESVPGLRDTLLVAQRNEITEYYIYRHLASIARDEANASVLERIAEAEKSHYQFWKGLSGEDVEPNRRRILWYTWVSRILGLTFGLKLMENGEGKAEENYEQIAQYIPEAHRIAAEEDEHERELIALIQEERLQYVGSVVLGLNDALVELTGTLAGLTLALQNVRLIAIAGLITGIAASLSMAASEYLSVKSGENGQEPVKAALYTGAAYVLTVIFLILPFFLCSSYLAALAFTLAVAILVILAFTYYISVARDMPFKRRFLEMAAISLGVAILSFGIGYAVRAVLQVDV